MTAVRAGGDVGQDARNQAHGQALAGTAEQAPVRRRDAAFGVFRDVVRGLSRLRYREYGAGCGTRLRVHSPCASAMEAGDHAEYFFQIIEF